MAKKEHSKKEVDPIRFISIHLRWLKFLGQIYVTDPPGSLKYYLRQLFKTIAFIMSLIFPITGESIYLIFNHDDVTKLADGLYLLMTEAMVPIKMIQYYTNKRLILELMADMNSDIGKITEPEHEPLVRFNINRIRFWSAYYYYLCFFAITASLLIPIAENFTVHPCNMQFPYVDAMSSPAYEIIFILQLYYKPTQVFIHASLETMPSAFMGFAISQLDILTFNLENFEIIIDRAMQRLVDGGREIIDDTAERMKFSREYLRRSIDHHQFILNFVQKIEDTYYIQVGLQFLLTVMIICLIGIKILSIDKPLHQAAPLIWTFGYLMCVLSNIFTVCFFGNELIWKSDYLTTAVYNGPWINLDEDMKRSILIFRERCKKPLMLHAAKLFDVSLKTFTSLMQWSYKAFAVMSTMKT